MTEEEVVVQPPDIIDERQAFDTERRAGIFSTDVASILGLSRYGSALSVYRAKRGELPPRETSLPAWIGLRLEGLVGELYTASTGNRVRQDNQAHFHPVEKWLGAHLDNRVVGEPRTIVEIKTRNSTRGWGEDGSADIPPDVWCQVQAQLFVVGGHECHVATLFSNSSFRVYKVLPDDAFAEEIVPTLRSFWFDNVLAGVPPLVTGHDADTAYVNGLPGGDSGVTRPATPEQEELVGQLVLAKTNEAQAKAVKMRLENRVKDIIGTDTDALKGAFGIIWFKRTKPSKDVKWQLVAKTYKLAAEELIQLAGPLDEVARITATVDLAEGLYTTPKDGVRRIRYDLQET